MNRFILVLVAIALISCKNPTEGKPISKTVMDTTSVKDFRVFKVLDSKYISNKDLWRLFNEELKDFSEEDYNRLKPLILEQDIPTLQQQITSGALSYERLTKFYLYRIRKFDRENELALNAVIAINPNSIQEAKQKDKERLNKKFKHPIFGMPILLKDNINTKHMPTTAGSVALQNNTTTDAFITQRLKAQGAIILGKTNLSEWAYFFCGDCPSGYSAIGGQTLNPYGRRRIDTGGSSSGSGVAMAANFSVAAVGSETSGSILSPSSQNSIVGLKPTIGLLSRSGIVPISSTLDTPGPMAKNVTDTAILLDAMLGFDPSDFKSIEMDLNGSLFEHFEQASLQSKRFGAFKPLLEDSLYVQAISDLKAKGAEVIEIEAQELGLPNFLRLLNLDMKKDLPAYLVQYAHSSVEVTSVQDVINFNKKDSMNIMPYGQRLFEGIVNDSGDALFLERIQDTLKTNGRRYFDSPMKTHNLDGFLSINNYHAGFAAVAEYPAITVPMGYAENGAPKGLTFISKPLSEKQLLNWAYVYEQTSKRRKLPVNYN